FAGFSDGKGHLHRETGLDSSFLGCGIKRRLERYIEIKSVCFRVVNAARDSERHNKRTKFVPHCHATVPDSASVNARLALLRIAGKTPFGFDRIYNPEHASSTHRSHRGCRPPHVEAAVALWAPGEGAGSPNSAKLPVHL